MRYKCQIVQYIFEWQKARMIDNVTMYGYKNILQAQQTPEIFYIPSKIGW